jgi:hypothetical protein
MGQKKDNGSGQVKLTLRLTGVPPGLLVHNEQLADPLSAAAQWLDELTRLTKKQKTPDILMETGRREWRGGLYLSEDGRVVIPANMVHGLAIAGARKSKLGKETEAGIIPAEPEYPLEYDGPKDIDALWADGRFVDRRGVRVGRAKVQRTRPIFRAWSLTVTYLVDSSIVEPKKVVKALEDAGQRVGLGDFRPRFGRFTVEQCK